MKNIGDQFPLDTTRLHLRFHDFSDWKEIFDYSQPDKYWRYLPIDRPTQADAKAFVRRMIRNKEGGFKQELNIAVCLRENRELIGDVRLVLTDKARLEAHVGCGFKTTTSGAGYATEAMTALADGAFAAGIHRLVGICDAENLASARMMTKVGFSYEGKLREYMLMRNEWRDCLIYSYLRGDRAETQFSRWSCSAKAEMS